MEMGSEANRFFTDIASEIVSTETINLKIGRYTVQESELHAEVVNWCLQYLTLRNCPDQLVPAIVQRVASRKKEFLNNDSTELSYDIQKVTQLIINIVSDVCAQMAEGNCKLEESTVSSNMEIPVVSECSERNMRRFMEDRHVVIHDLNALYGTGNADQIGFYAVFDGHDGVLAASYGATHLPYKLSSNPTLKSDPVNSLIDAFRDVDKDFVQKCKDQKLKSGTTAVCALYFPKEKKVFVSWVGDSQALLAKQGVPRHVVKPHKPEDAKEYQRIKDQGGSVMHWKGQYRVNGILAISRAIGDCNQKPFILCEPDTECIHLEGTEDFLILATDGLWDYIQQENATDLVYSTVKENPTDANTIAEKLVKAAKVRGSQDNITVLVIFLKHPSRIAELCQSGVIKTPIASSTSSLGADDTFDK